jgi:DNA (cytosine-5)-methyltransferase 1
MASVRPRPGRCRVTATVTDLFCGAGGSSLGARAAGLELVMAANHWSTAIDVHQVHFPDAAHDCADITQVDPRRYPRTDILLASPECTNHSQARGVSRQAQHPGLWDAPDPAAERSRATMWDVCRFAEQMRYDAIVVENVVEATKWVGWRGWHQVMADLGYKHRVLSHNSMHHGVAQSRDRIYVVFWRAGLQVDLEMERTAWCTRCQQGRVCRQAWKSERSVGRYRQQWRWACTTCGTTCEPATTPAAEIIDWSLNCPRIGERARPLAAATRARILAGLQRHGWAPVTTSGAGNVHERTPGNRSRPVTDPLPTQQTTATTAMATPPGFLFATHHSGRTTGLDQPHPTVCASDDRQSLVTPAGLMVQVAHGLDKPSRVRTTDEPCFTTMATGSNGALVIPLRTNGEAFDAADHPVGTVTAGGNHHGLLMRNNTARGNHHGLLMRNNTARGDQGQMVTPVTEPARTMTTTGHQSLLLPYYGTGQAQPVDRPVPTIPTRDRFALLDPEEVVDDCGFRMLEPHEIAAAMAFPEGYIPSDLTKKDRVKLAGNAVTPPVMQWITGRLLQAMEAAAS